MPSLLHKSNGHLLRKSNGHLAFSLPVQWYRVNYSGLGVFYKNKEQDYSSEVPPYNFEGNPSTYYDPESYYFNTQSGCDNEFAALTDLSSGSSTFKEGVVGSISQYQFRGTYTRRASQIFKFTSITPVNNPTSNTSTGSTRTLWGTLRYRDIQEASVNLSGSVTGWKNLNHDLAGTNTGLSFGINFDAFSTASACTGSFAASSSGSGGSNIEVSVGGLSAIKAMMTTDSITDCAIKFGLGFSGVLPAYFGDAEYYGGEEDPWLIIATGEFLIKQTASLGNLWIRI